MFDKSLKNIFHDVDRKDAPLIFLALILIILGTVSAVLAVGLVIELYSIFLF